jgi:AraC family transcriptional activator of mtrCDE
MTSAALERLLASLNVTVEALCICALRQDQRLDIAPQGAVGVFYVLSGTLHLAARDAAPLVCKAGCMVLVPPNLATRLSSQTATGDLRIARGLIVAGANAACGLLDSLTAPIVAQLCDVDFVRHAFGVMLREAAQPALGGRALTESLMKACLVQVIRRHLGDPQEQPSFLKAWRDPRLGKAVALILDAPAAAHSVASLASAAGMSRSTFAKTFAGALHMTPMEFVGRTRLHHAAELLRATSVPIKMIAANIGFASRSHFSRAFRQAYGADPTRFRAAAKPAQVQIDGAPSCDQARIVRF